MDEPSRYRDYFVTIPLLFRFHTVTTSLPEVNQVSLTVTVTFTITVTVMVTIMVTVTVMVTFAVTVRVTLTVITVNP